MNMKIIKSEKCLCVCCMEIHEVKTVLVREKVTFKRRKVDYDALYQYCDNSDELYMDERQIQENDIRLKNAYRKKEGLLTSDEICAIRAKYNISQKDLCTLLGWGGKTITRYESHQVQDKAHDTILKKIDEDPEWFLILLNDAREYLSTEAYQKYLGVATALYEENRDAYLRKAIEASYAKYQGNLPFYHNPAKTVYVRRNVEHMLECGYFSSELELFLNLKRTLLLSWVKSLSMPWPFSLPRSATASPRDDFGST